MNSTKVENFFKRSLFLTGILAIFLARSLRANPGGLDPAFGQNGTTVVGIPGTSSYEAGNAVAVQPDGKVLITGYADRDLAILRLNADGTKDTTFGTGGKVAANFSGGIDVGNAVAVLPDGRFIVAGMTEPTNGAGHFLVARYLTNGVLDTAFGTSGSAVISFGNPASSPGQANGLAIQPDGKIILAGSTSVSGSQRTIGVARLNADGSLDSTFGTGGVVTTYAGSAAYANAVTLQSDGKVLVAGSSVTPAINDQFTIARYLSNGSPDTTFGSNGLVTFQYGNRSCAAYGIALQSSGKIIVGGEIGDTDTNGVEGGFMVARLNTNGSLDTTFGSTSGMTGIYLTGSVQNNARALLVFSDDSIMLVGSAQLSGQGLNYAAAAFYANGIFLNAFRYSADFSANYTEQGLAAAIQANNMIVIAGQTDQNDEGDMGVVGLDGVQSFGQFPGMLVSALAYAVTVLPDGQIVAAGNSGGSPTSVSVVRLNTDGSPDPNFGDGGVVSVCPKNAGCSSLAIQPDGAIVAAGLTYQNGVYQFLLLRFKSGGALDPTFATNGVGLYNLRPGATYGAFYSVRIQPDGKIVAAGVSGTNFLIARFLANGISDAAFGSGGFVTISAGSYSPAYDVQILPGGKIIAAGELGPNFGAVQVNSDGSLDTTFGTGGIQASTTGTAKSIAIQADGKIVIAGYAGSSAQVMRCLPNGTLDSTFGIGGIMKTNFGATYLSGNGVVIQANGRIVVGGGYENYSVNPSISDFGVFRLLPNGTVDSSFGSGGLVHNNVPLSAAIHQTSLNGLAIQSDGSIIAAGAGVGPTTQGFGFARYLGDVVGLDTGLRAYDGSSIIKFACEGPGTTNSPVRFNKNGTNYGVLLTFTNSPYASRFHIQTSSGVNALMKLP